MKVRPLFLSTLLIFFIGSLSISAQNQNNDNEKIKELISKKRAYNKRFGFGYRIHPVYKVKKFHQGMDFTAPRGTPIYASGDGKVTRADSGASGYGKHIRIDHGYGYLTLYAHLSKYNVTKGKR